MEHIKLQASGEEFNDCYLITDTKTDGRLFYEEIRFLCRAKRFVQTWNSHDDLVEALKSIAKIPCISELLGEPIEDDFGRCGCACCQAKQAIAKAEETYK